MGLLNDEDEQNLEMNIDLSKADRNCNKIVLFNSTFFFLLLLCSSWMC
jgi:hypothetical protein